MKFYLLVIFASFFFAFQLHGQSDSIKTHLNLSGEVVKKIAHDKEMIVKTEPPIRNEPTGISLLILVFLSLSFTFLVISLPFYFNYKKTKGRQLIITKLIEKGSEIPKELIAPTTKSERSDFHKGVILIALGISISIVLLALKIESNFWTIGIIPIFVGIGYLISFKFDNPSSRNNEIE